MTRLSNIISVEPRLTQGVSFRPHLGWLPWLGSGLVVAGALVAGGYPATVVSFALIYAVFVIGLNVFMGFANQVSFGQNAFAAIGGYSSAILTANESWPVLPAMGVGVVLALAAAALIGVPTLRLKGHYLAMGTLAIGLIVYEITVEWQSLTQGYLGISGIPPLGLGPWEVTSDRGTLVTLAVIVLALSFAAFRLQHSRLGRALAAVAGSEDAARALGIGASRIKLLAFLISAALAAISGSLFVHVVGYVSPEVFGLHMVIQTFTMLYVGGIGTTAGPLLGALVITLLPEIFRPFSEYQDLAYGVALIIMLIYAPRGFSALFRRRNAV